MKKARAIFMMLMFFYAGGSSIIHMSEADISNLCSSSVEHICAAECHHHCTLCDYHFTNDFTPVQKLSEKIFRVCVLADFKLVSASVKFRISAKTGRAPPLHDPNC